MNRWPSCHRCTQACGCMPIVADFTRLESLPELSLLRAAGADPGRRVVFFPGSTIGNFTPEEAVGLLRRVRRMAGPDALLIVGADSTQDPKVLIPAYDDREGVTAEFNKNLLERINRELAADFDLDAFATRRASTRSSSGSRCIWSAGARSASPCAAARFMFAAGRIDPHRELLQVQPAEVSAARRASRLDASAAVDRRPGALCGARARTGRTARVSST